ncbi:hypothetical protein NP493_482g02003 [Ridgeia piscesae]|uniref:Transcription initiation factor TFIID subunit 9 n=1 Tax=Ridgeia piscesae TaxID=27915 RepID=A0AAD9KXP7_RIDPI|nr:hypothetical protein NP493_482g02003 [Ridgeia piscesae]
MAAQKNIPKDAQVMMAILKEMGVTEYEPRVINQMLEFSYRYITDVLDEAKVYSSHANKKMIDVEDVKLAVQCLLEHSFTSPPPRDLLMDLARQKNSVPLPPIRPYTGPKLPPERYCLTAANYRLKPLRKPSVESSAMPLVLTSSGLSRIGTQQQLSGIGKLSSHSLAGGKLSLNMMGRGAPGQPTITIKPAPTSTVLSVPSSITQVPIIRFNPGQASGATVIGGHMASVTPKVVMSTIITPSQPSVSTVDISSLKRKHEDDDYDAS